MRNRAKCKLCQSIIESFHSSDLVLCKCGEISVDGGDGLKCAAKDWSNFLRVDDEGNEIIVKIKGVENEIDDAQNDKAEKPTKNDILKAIESTMHNLENLPQAAMLSPLTHYDYISILMLLQAILKCN